MYPDQAEAIECPVFIEAKYSGENSDTYFTTTDFVDKATLFLKQMLRLECASKQFSMNGITNVLYLVFSAQEMTNINVSSVCENEFTVTIPEKGDKGGSSKYSNTLFLWDETTRKIDVYDKDNDNDKKVEANGKGIMYKKRIIKEKPKGSKAKAAAAAIITTTTDDGGDDIDIAAGAATTTTTVDDTENVVYANDLTHRDYVLIEKNGSNYNFRFFIGSDLKVDFLFIAGKEQIEGAFGRYLGNRPQYYKEMSKDKGQSPLVDYVASIKHPDIDCEEFKTVSFNEFLDLDLDSLSTEIANTYTNITTAPVEMAPPPDKKQKLQN